MDSDRAIQRINRGYCFAVVIDLAKFFDTVDHDVLMHKVSRRVTDKGILKLIGKYLQWFHRRVRMCYWKQWRSTKKRVRELMKRGVGERHAVKAGMSRKAYWHLAKTEAINVGLSNAYLTKQGLTSMRTL
jgi:hypothetical protein